MLEYVVMVAAAVIIPVAFVVRELSKARKRNIIVSSRLRTTRMSDTP